MCGIDRKRSQAGQWRPDMVCLLGWKTGEAEPATTASSPNHTPCWWRRSDSGFRTSFYSAYAEEHILKPFLVPALVTTPLAWSKITGFRTEHCSFYQQRRTCFCFSAACSLSCLAATVPSVPALSVGSVLDRFRSSLPACLTRTIPKDRFSSRRVGWPESQLPGRQTFNDLPCIQVAVGIVAGEPMGRAASLIWRL